MYNNYNVTGSAKRYTNAHTMIFLYKRCYSKTRNIFYSLKKKNLGLRYLQLFAYTHAKFEELNVLLTGQAYSTVYKHSLTVATNLVLSP